MDESTFLIVGANGQLGQALKAQYPKAHSVDIDELDISKKGSVEEFNWSKFKVILNAAAYTNVDGAESGEGRIVAWQANALAIANLAQAAIKHDLIVVHVSTDYVFDGSKDNHKEDEPFSPLSVYGSSKAGGDIVLGLLPKHYIIRTSWVIGNGKNFARTMIELAKKGVSPSVVSDQIGRLTFTSELVRAIKHLLDNNSAYGTYNVSNDGPSVSWADITRKIFELGQFPNQVSDVTTVNYYKGKVGIAPRPMRSTLDLSKIHQTGFASMDWQEELAKYVRKELSQ